MLRTAWVVDAMGRRRFLQRKLALTKPNHAGLNAVWFRIAERVDVADLVPETHGDWHNRVQQRRRYWSTNHLCGEGYWLWLIALVSDHTSIGLVTDARVHDFNGLKCERDCRRWLEQHEPDLARRLRGRVMADFRVRPAYSYSAQQVYSSDRWACTGEAAVFADPMYSTGTDLIGFGNSMIVSMVAADRAGKLTDRRVRDLNRFLLTYNDGLTGNIRQLYTCFGNAVVASFKVLWDTLAGWTYNVPLMTHSLYLEEQNRVGFRKSSGRFFFLARRVQKLFDDWSRQSRRRVSFDYLDFFRLPFFREIRRKNLGERRTLDQLAADQMVAIDFFEELAQVIFLWALADCHPRTLSAMPVPLWLNAWAIDLDTSHWESRGLFRPKTERRDLKPILEPLTGIFVADDTDLLNLLDTKSC